MKYIGAYKIDYEYKQKITAVLKLCYFVPVAVKFGSMG